MENEIREKIKRWKVKAEDFLKDNVKAFIVDVNDTYYFCKIVFVGDISVHVENFKGKRESEKDNIYWADIIKFEEYKEEGK